MVPILNCGTSIFAGFVVFSVLGFMSHQTGLPVSTVATGGPGLAFVTYPEAITMLPCPQLWAVMFFLMLFLLGLDTCFVQIEAIISSIIDEYPKLRKRKKEVALLFCCIMYVTSTIFVTNGGIYLLQLFDWYAGSISVILICFVEVFMVGWAYGIDRFVADVEFMIGEKVHWWWRICWKMITPIILVFIFITSIAFNTTITYHGYIYPKWSVTTGWASCASSILCIPLYMGYKLLYLTEGDLVERIETSIRPSLEWGPANKEHRREWFLVNNYEIVKDIASTKTLTADEKYHQQFISLC